jgi:hypothetical protein
MSLLNLRKLTSWWLLVGFIFIFIDGSNVSPKHLGACSFAVAFWAKSENSAKLYETALRAMK